VIPIGGTRCAAATLHGTRALDYWTCPLYA
jgi:hypothetical protein